MLAACAQTLSAQDLFTVRVGIFRGVKITEFAEIKPLGFLYGLPGEDNTTEVFVGHFDTQDKAVATATNLQQRGYRNAQAFKLPTGNAPQSFIQLSLHSGTRPIEWAALERAGQLFVQSSDGLSKIMTGPYPTPQDAAAALPAVKALGYRDAFVKNIDPTRLIAVSTFETGIKKPLIPINLQNTPPTTPAPTPAPAPQPDNMPLSPPSSSPATYGSTAPAPAPAAPSVTSPSAYAPPPGMELTAGPVIDGKTKRSSAAELQRVLKEKGYYEGNIDGFYGPGTSGAFAKAWAGLPEIKKYKLLAQLLPREYLAANWEETLVLLAVADDMAAGSANGERQESLLAQRPTLYTANTTLSPVATTRVRNWAATTWANLDDWATEDPLHGRIFSAFRVAYHQTQVRLEDHYMDLGLGPIEARDLATAMLQNLLAARLDRFL